MRGTNSKHIYKHKSKSSNRHAIRFYCKRLPAFQHCGHGVKYICVNRMYHSVYIYIGIYMNGIETRQKKHHNKRRECRTCCCVYTLSLNITWFRVLLHSLSIFVRKITYVWIAMYRKINNIKRLYGFVVDVVNLLFILIFLMQTFKNSSKFGENWEILYFI